MKKYSIILVIISLILFSCNKDHKIVKKLSGKWEIVKYSQTDASSITQDVMAEGVFEFDKYEKKEQDGGYAFNYNYGSELNNNASSIGRYFSNTKDEAIYLIPSDSTGGFVSKQKFHVDKITTSDIIFDFEDEHQMTHRFVLKKLK